VSYLYTGQNADEVNSVLAESVNAFKQIVGNNLKGLYLHGSMAMGCFRPWSSDIDLLAVVFEPMEKAVKLALVEEVMGIAEGGNTFRSLEFSVVTEDEAARAAHPINYILHYSNSWHQAYREGRAELVVTGGADEDLAAHFMVTRQRGLVLHGAPIHETFGEVTTNDYLKAVWYDIASAAEQVADKPVYTVLNLCRTLMYLETGHIGSKREGGQWAVLQPELVQWKTVVADAVQEYETAEAGRYNSDDLAGFVCFMMARIQK
jgi:predicted nucleotidyltransferase